MVIYEHHFTLQVLVQDILAKLNEYNAFYVTLIQAKVFYEHLSYLVHPLVLPNTWTLQNLAKLRQFLHYSVGHPIHAIYDCRLPRVAMFSEQYISFLFSRICYHTKSPDFFEFIATLRDFMMPWCHYSYQFFSCWLPLSTLLWFCWLFYGPHDLICYLK